MLFRPIFRRCRFLLSSISGAHCSQEAKGRIGEDSRGVFANTQDPRPAFFANPVPLFPRKGLGVREVRFGVCDPSVEIICVVQPWNAIGDLGWRLEERRWWTWTGCWKNHMCWHPRRSYNEEPEDWSSWWRCIELNTGDYWRRCGPSTGGFTFDMAKVGGDGTMRMGWGFLAVNKIMVSKPPQQQEEEEEGSSIPILLQGRWRSLMLQRNLEMKSCAVGLRDVTTSRCC